VPPGVPGDRVLLTIFNRRTQPLIRYEISDMLRFSNEKCECGRPFRCLEEIEGRQEDVLYFRARADSERMIALHPNVFHRPAPAAGWQVVQDDQGISVNLTGLREEAGRSQIEIGCGSCSRPRGLRCRRFAWMQSRNCGAGRPVKLRSLSGFRAVSQNVQMRCDRGWFTDAASPD
jgi:hypothetical protein